MQQKRLPAFGRRSRTSSTSNSRQITPRDSQLTDEPAAYPDKTDSARGSLSAAVGGSGGKFESIMSFIAAKEEEADASVDGNSTTDAASSHASRSVSASSTPPRSAGTSSTLSSSPVSASSAHHHRSMSAAVNYPHSPAAIHPLSSTTSLPRTPLSRSTPSTVTASTPNSASPFDAYKAKVHSLTHTINTLESSLHSLQQQHDQHITTQNNTHADAITLLHKQYEARLTEQLSFIEQLVTTKQQLTAELDATTDRVKQREEQLLARHVELELAAEEKLKQRLEAAQQQWREREMRLMKAGINRAMEREVGQLKARQAEEVRLLDEKWKEKFSTTREELERQALTREAEVRRRCAEDGKVEREREERRRDELVRQMTLDLTTKQAEVSRQHEQERRSDRQRWEEEKQADADRRHRADTEREERLTREWQQRLIALQQSHEADKQRHESECDHKLQRAIADAEEQLRAQVRREGEAELAHVIERLGEETVQLSKDERAKHRQAIDQLQRERTEERSTWTEKERMWQVQLDRCNEQLKATQVQLKKQGEEWQARWKEAEEWKQQLDQLHAERQRSAVVQQHGRQQDSDALSALQQQLKRGTERWKRERQQLLDEQQEERAAWQSSRSDEKHTRELREVERRVKETVRKKDEVIDGLQIEMRRLQGQIVTMTDTIEQQKHELLSLG